jgi:hypothetical protein
MREHQAEHRVSGARRDVRWSAGFTRPSAETSIHTETLIHAEPQRVYSHLIDVRRWPHWYPQVERVQIPDEVRLGGPFGVEMCGAYLNVMVCEHEPDSRFGWVGAGSDLSVYQSWRLTADPEGTRVIAEFVVREQSTVREMDTGEVYQAHQAALLQLKHLVEAAGSEDQPIN